MKPSRSTARSLLQAAPPSAGKRGAASAKRIGLLLVALAVPGQARRAQPLLPELVLAADAPIVAVRLAGQVVRLRVDPGQWSAIELDPAVAARLPLVFEPGMDVEVGRITLVGRVAQARLEVAGRTLPVQLAEHGRPPAGDADGVIGPDLLPYAAIRWHGADAPAPSATVTLPLHLDEEIGLSADAGLPPLRLRFSLLRDSEATAAAGARIAQAGGGHFDRPAAPAPAAFGLQRASRPLALDRTLPFAGFRFDRIAVRVGDYRGGNALPDDPAPPADIVVRGRKAGQHAEYWLTIGRDRLSRCRDIVYRAAPRTLALSCAFD